MKTYGDELTVKQIEAGLKVMRGEFSSSSVMKALSEAGVTNCMPGAETLIDRELREGRIRKVTQGIYRASA